MELSIWLLFVVTDLAMSFSPGPAVLYVTSHGLSRGFGASIAANFGTITGNLIFFAASALGLGALLLSAHPLFLVVKWVGIAYIIWLGLQMIFTKKSIAQKSSVQISMANIYKGGLLLQIANPKNLIYFLVVLPPFIDPQENVLQQVFILGLTSQIFELLILLGYGYAASKAGGWFQRSTKAMWIDRLAGSALIGIAASLAFLKRATP